MSEHHPLWHPLRLPIATSHRSIMELLVYIICYSQQFHTILFLFSPSSRRGETVGQIRTTGGAKAELKMSRNYLRLKLTHFNLVFTRLTLYLPLGLRTAWHLLKFWYLQHKLPLICLVRKIKHPFFLWKPTLKIHPIKRLEEVLGVTWTCCIGNISIKRLNCKLIFDGSWPEQHCGKRSSCVTHCSSWQHTQTSEIWNHV